MKKVLVFLANGFEEVEAITVIDYLCRVGLEVVLVSLEDLEVHSSLGITIKCEVLVKDVAKTFDIDSPVAVFFPGGLKNAETASKNPLAKELTIKAFSQGALVAGICAAPALVLYPWGILQGRAYTCYPGLDSELEAKSSNTRTMVDGNLITAIGPGASEEFAFELVKYLVGEKALTTLKQDILAR